MPSASRSRRAVRSEISSSSATSAAVTCPRDCNIRRVATSRSARTPPLWPRKPARTRPLCLLKGAISRTTRQAGIVPYYRHVGDVPRKRHTLVKRPGGEGYLAEELMGQEGFAQESALLYHDRSPSAIVSVEHVEDPSAIPFTVETPVV